MRLINIHTLQLTDFFDVTPRYIILSHRWTDDELTYKDFVKGRNRSSNGSEKILKFCDYVREESWKETVARVMFNEKPTAPEVEWVWVDTVCIDKRSSAELSEAINSMWAWYRNADRCIAYLSDVQSSGILEKWDEFHSSRWFTRGWTLQELLAPNIVTFVDNNWRTIGTLEQEDSLIVNHVAHASGIEREYLHGRLARVKSLEDACVAKKFAWAARRETTRGEDMAYCLLGLLNVNMPLLYGEGRQRAFIRLQQEIIRQSDDESIFAWQRRAMQDEPFGLLAPDIRHFQYSRSVQPIPADDPEYTYRQPYAVTNKGVSFETLAYQLELNRMGTTNDDEAPMPTFVMTTTDFDCEETILHSVEEQVAVDDRSDQLFLVQLNCHCQINETNHLDARRKRCAIILREGPGHIAYRIMAASLHPDVIFSAKQNAFNSFIVKLTSAY